MTIEGSGTRQDALISLLREQGIQRIAIIDDAYDSLNLRGLTTEQAQDLWNNLKENAAFFEEVAKLGKPLNGSTDLSEGIIDTMLDKPSDFPAFVAAWNSSRLGKDVNAQRKAPDKLLDLLTSSLDLEGRSFGNEVVTEDLENYSPQILFIDWDLGSGGDQVASAVISGGEQPQGVQAAIEKTQDIKEEWSDSGTWPLIILMSSWDNMKDYADDFCRETGILGGMFYAVSKNDLTTAFTLRMYMSLFAKSLAPGRQLQKFIDTLNEELESVGKEFSKRVGALSLTDYSYIKSLSLQDEGHPLGDYLTWLLGSYLGQLLFSDALGSVSSALDRMNLDGSLPTLHSPSDALTEMYHLALFNTSVGPVSSMPRIQSAGDSTETQAPALALGDVFQKMVGGQDTPTDDEDELPENGEPDGERRKHDLLMVINPQCDLVFTPGGGSRPVDKSRSILLLPGELRSLDCSIQQGRPVKTELYRQDNENYRIEWYTKEVKSVPLGEFNDWTTDAGYKRVARIRLPFALEIQHAFAADLTRVGNPVMPPIYQTLPAQLLRGNGDIRVYEHMGDLQDEEGAFLVLARYEGELRQKCVLTIPLLVKLKSLLDEKLEEMKTELRSGDGSNEYLSQRIDTLERLSNEDSRWAEIRKPFDLPTSSNPKKFVGGYLHVLLGPVTDLQCDGKVVAAVSVDVVGDSA